MKIVLTTKFTEGGMQMRHVFDELEAQGLKPEMLFKNDHDEIIFEVPAEKTGKWKDCGEKEPWYRCSECNEKVWGAHKNYCPNCGAKMKGDKE